MFLKIKTKDFVQMERLNNKEFSVASDGQQRERERNEYISL